MGKSLTSDELRLATAAVEASVSHTDHWVQRSQDREILIRDWGREETCIVSCLFAEDQSNSFTRGITMTFISYQIVYSLQHIHTHTYIRTYIYTNTSIHTSIHPSIHTYIHTLTHTHTHTHTGSTTHHLLISIVLYLSNLLYSLIPCPSHSLPSF